MTVFRVNNSFSLLALALVAGLAQSCAPSQDNPTPTTTLNLSRYVAVGDSYTAGVSNGGLTRSGQEYSYANLLAQSFESVVPSAGFTQPLLAAGTGTGYLALVSYTGSGVPTLRRVPGDAVRGNAIINPTACGGPDTLRLFNRTSTDVLPQNLGLPNLRLGQIETTGLGNEASATPGAAFNPYFERILPGGSNSTYLQSVSAAASSATFFTYFAGLDDLLPYLRSGGECGGLTTSATRTLLINQMNDNAKKLLDVLTAGGRPGIIGRLPDLNTLPLLRLGKGDELQRRTQIALNDTSLRVYIQAHISAANPALRTRKITDQDYVLATALGRVGQPVSVGGVSLRYGLDANAPIAAADVVENNELTSARNVVNAYNLRLDDLAKNQYKMPALDDSNYSTLNIQDQLFNLVVSSIAIDGVQYTTEPVRGNFFSYDYYSLTPRGNALLANFFIRAINRAYQSNIPSVNVNNLPTVAQ